MATIAAQLHPYRNDKYFEGEDWSFWEEAVSTVEFDANDEISDYAGRAIVMQLGVCSHWLRPHQTRWTAAGGFAYPSGYIGGRWSRTGLPEYDWNYILEWCPFKKHWILHDISWRVPKRHFLFRLTLPTRTLRHKQAVVHALWMHGTPSHPRKKQLSFYGFRQMSDGWQLCAHWCSSAKSDVVR